VIIYQPQCLTVDVLVSRSLEIEAYIMRIAPHLIQWSKTGVTIPIPAVFIA
jgi:hypothetical protein